jgi:hypothetical protein
MLQGTSRGNQCPEYPPRLSLSRRFCGLNHVKRLQVPKSFPRPYITSAGEPANRSRYRNPDNDPQGPYLLADVTSPFDRPTQRYEWHGQVPPAGRSWRFTKAEAEALDAEGRIALTTAGRPRLKRYLSEAVEEETLQAPTSGTSQLEFIVRNAMRAIAIAIAENPACLRDVEWRDLERVLREVFEKLGYVTRLTRSGNDGGFDLQLNCTDSGVDKQFLVEVKHWAGSGKKPGRPVLKSLVDVVAKATSSSIGLILSSTGFTTNVLNGRTEVEQKTVRLGGRAKIVSLCQNYLQDTAGIFKPTTGLADMLLEGTS